MQYLRMKKRNLNSPIIFERDQVKSIPLVLHNTGSFMLSAYRSAQDGKEPGGIPIGFDAKRAFFNSSGLGNYSRNLLNALVINHPQNSYYLFTPKTKDRFFLENEDSFSIIGPQGMSRLFSSLWRTAFMTNNIKKLKLEIFHGLSQELPYGIGKSGARSVVTIHDLIFLRFPHFYKSVDTKIYYRKVVHACRTADHIVAISEQTRNDIIEFLDISPEKITVIYQGCSPDFRKSFSKEVFLEIKERYKLPDRYLLYTGTIEERKNLLGIAKAIHVSGIDIPLVVIGRKTEPYYRKVLEYINSNNLKSIIFPGKVTNGDLPALYQNAECFLYPSFFEGFGIPIVEALVSKTPVITSNTGCFPEAGGPGSIYVDPYDPGMIGDAILRVVKNKDVREKMVNIGSAHALKFRDEVIAEAYMKLYNSLLQ